MRMNIKEFSNITNVSAYTIRYYEKIGILKNIGRSASGHRFFTQDDINWLIFVKRLKDTGMPLEIIKTYADLKSEGECTNDQRMQLLEEHAEKLEKKINLEISHLGKLKNKIICLKNK